MTDQVKVNPSAVQAFAVTLIGVVIGIVGGVTTVVHLLSARDMAGLYNWLQGADFVSFIGYVMAAYSLLYLPMRSVVRKLREVYLSWHTDDSVSVTTSAVAAPPAVPPASVAEAVTNLVTKGSLTKGI